MTGEKRKKRKLSSKALILAAALVIIVALPNIKLGKKAVVCTSGQSVSPSKGALQLFSLVHGQLSSTSLVEVFNISGKKEGAMLDFIGPKGKLLQSCAISLDAYAIESIPVYSSTSVARLTTVSEKIGGRVKGNSYNIPFRNEREETNSLILNSRSRKSGSFILANLEGKKSNFQLTSLTFSGEKNDKLAGGMPVLLNAFEIKSFSLSELTEVAAEAAVINITPVDKNGTLSRANYNFSYLSDDGTLIKSQKHISDIGYMAVGNSAFKARKNNKLKNIVSFYNLSDFETSLNVYFQNPSGQVLPVSAGSSFCGGKGRIENEHLILDFKAGSTIDCNADSLLKELGVGGGNLVLIPNSKAAISARSSFYQQQKKGALKLAYSNVAKHPAQNGNYKIIAVNLNKGAEAYLNLYNPSDKGVSFPLTTLTKGPKPNSQNITLKAFSSLSLPASSKAGKAQKSNKLLIKTSPAVSADLIQGPSAKGTGYNLFESDSIKDLDDSNKPSEGQFCSSADSALKADFNRDGVVDENDKFILESNSGTNTKPGCNGDVDGDGDVDEFDLMLMGIEWNGPGGIDTDSDGVFNHKDCSPDDGSTWQNEAYSDPDEDGFRDTDSKSKVKCFGEVAPTGSVSSETILDNCPGIPNPDQFDYDGNGVGDACAYYQEEGSSEQGGNSNQFPNPQTFKPLKSNPNGLQGEEEVK